MSKANGHDHDLVPYDHEAGPAAIYKKCFHLIRYVLARNMGESGYEAARVYAEKLKYLGATKDGRLLTELPTRKTMPERLKSDVEDIIKANYLDHDISGISFLPPPTQAVREAEDDYERWHVYTGSEILKKAVPEPDWLAKGVLARNQGLLHSGLPKSGKSLSWLAGAIQMAAGKQLWGHFRTPVEPPHVLFVETEDPFGLVQRRALHLADGMGISKLPRTLHIVTPGSFSLVSEGFEKLSELIRETHADVLILSTLQGLIVGKDWSAVKDMGEVNAKAVQLQKLAALALITHSPVDGSARAIGTVSQAANYSTLMHFTKTKNTIEATLDSKESTPSTFYLEMKLDKDAVDKDGDDVTHVVDVSYLDKGVAKLKEKAQHTKKIDAILKLMRDGKSVRAIKDKLGVGHTSADYKEAKAYFTDEQKREKEL